MILSTNNIDNLQPIVKLTQFDCAKFRVKLVPSKTKLLAFHTESQKELVEFAKIVNQISIPGVEVKFYYITKF